MLRDPKFFDDAEAFKPERHLERVKGYESTDEALNGFFPDDPSSIVFGFGRRCVNTKISSRSKLLALNYCILRICPGRYFADANLWLFIACFLAVFDVGYYVNPDTGLEEEPEIIFSTGALRKPSPFKYRVSPRSARHADLIRGAVNCSD